MRWRIHLMYMLSWVLAVKERVATCCLQPYAATYMLPFSGLGADFLNELERRFQPFSIGKYIQHPACVTFEL